MVVSKEKVTSAGSFLGLVFDLWLPVLIVGVLILELKIFELVSTQKNLVYIV